MKTRNHERNTSAQASSSHLCFHLISVLFFMKIYIFDIVRQPYTKCKKFFALFCLILKPQAAFKIKIKCEKYEILSFVTVP